MSKWFLPDTPDVIGLLVEQVRITQLGLAAFVAWCGGDEASSDEVRRLEHEADTAKRAVRDALRRAFTTPVDAEDLYVLSERLDTVLNGAKNAIRESEVMATPPDAAVAAMAAELAEAVDHLADAIAALGTDGDVATAAADAAVRSRRAVERSYRKAMSSLLEVDDLREVMSRRELYRRLARLADVVEEVADRVWYAVVKEA